MAERKRSNQTTNGAKRRSSSERSARRSARSSARANGAGKLSAGDAIQRVRAELPELLGRKVESIVGVRRDEAGWHVRAQIVELSRIPNSTDVLGVYRVDLEPDGELVGYQRERRYNRGQPDED